MFLAPLQKASVCETEYWGCRRPLAGSWQVRPGRTGRPAGSGGELSAETPPRGIPHNPFYGHKTPGTGWCEVTWHQGLLQPVWQAGWHTLIPMGVSIGHTTASIHISPNHGGVNYFGAFFKQNMHNLCWITQKITKKKLCAQGYRRERLGTTVSPNGILTDVLKEV